MRSQPTRRPSRPTSDPARNRAGGPARQPIHGPTHGLAGSPAALLLLLLGAGLACASPAASDDDARRYRLAHSGAHWDVVRGDRVFDDLEERYPSFFDVVLDPRRSDEPPTRRIRRDLEWRPVDRRNFDALNALAIGYFELNYRGETARGQAGLGFMSAGFRTAKLAAIPWRAYGEVEDPALREAILDFFEDAGTGHKLGAQATAGRLGRIVASLEAKEADPARRARIAELAARIEAAHPAP